MKSKGIFCIEGIWDHDDITDKSSILPILHLLRERKICDYVHRGCATISELEFLLKHWSEKSVRSQFPILYLAFHGNRGCIVLNNDTEVHLTDISLLLEGKCRRCVIYFGSCSTVDLHGNTIRSFLKKTKAAAVIGYKSDIDWLKSAACDLLVFDILQGSFFTKKGVFKIENNIESEFQNLQKLLGLKLTKL